MTLDIKLDNIEKKNIYENDLWFKKLRFTEQEKSTLKLNKSNDNSLENRIYIYIKMQDSSYKFNEIVLAKLLLDGSINSHNILKL